MPKRKQSTLKPKKLLDTIPGKRGRGRPGVRPSLISGRACNYRLIFSQIWNDTTNARGETQRGVGDALLKAQTEEEVIQAFDPWLSYQPEFAPLAGLILKVLRDKDFPKRRGPQMNFLADSLAARGVRSARRSRDICDQERKKKVNYIIRQDYYIECTCRYKGPALHGKCPKCGTGQLSPSLVLLGLEGA
jgi:hypothetical protein